MASKANRNTSFKERISKNLQTNNSNASKENVMNTLLKQARKSGVLNLSSRNLGEVPKSVWRINIDTPEEGKSISLDQNTDDRWWEQVDLIKLILASNGLSYISEDISMLPALTVLDIHDNQLTTLPDSLAMLTELVKLNISQNSFNELPKSVFQLKKLYNLQAQHNQIVNISDSIGYLNNLEELDLSSNQLVELSPCIDYLTKLTKLNLCKNKLKSIPIEIESLKNLNTLDLSSNQLESVVDGFGRLSRLEMLYLQFNKITEFPLLDGCPVLKELHLGKNNIRTLPANHLSALVSMAILDLKDNQLENIPEEICDLQHLERLDVSNNNLATLPNSLGMMDNLKAIFVDGNPMRCIRRDIILRGTVELKKFLRSRITSSSSSSPLDPPSSSSSSSSSLRNVNKTISNVDHNANKNNLGNHGDKIFDEYLVMSTKILNISNKKLTEIPESCMSLAVKCGVTQIDASKNNISEFPIGLQDVCTSLNELDLSFNKLSSLADEVGVLTKLIYLNLSNNQLTNLPDQLKSLKHLREINLNMNRFTIFPTCLYQIKSIEIIMLSDNKIEKLQVDDNGLLSMPKLSVLDLQNNNINNIPPSLGNCIQLRSLKLEGNSFRNPNASTLAKGTAALLEYLRNRIPG